MNPIETQQWMDILRQFDELGCLAARMEVVAEQPPTDALGQLHRYSTNMLPGLTRLRDAILAAHAPQEQQWIPCSERLPDVDDCRLLLVCIGEPRWYAPEEQPWLGRFERNPLPARTLACYTKSGWRMIDERFVQLIAVNKRLTVLAWYSVPAAPPLAAPPVPETPAQPYKEDDAYAWAKLIEWHLTKHANGGTLDETDRRDAQRDYLNFADVPR